jgi:hypothetical protein
MGLLDSYPGATVLLSLSKESSVYAGNCLLISRSNSTSQTAIGFSGNNLDMTALNAYLAGGTAFVDRWYDQSGNANDALPVSAAKRLQIIVDTDGKPTLKGLDAGSGMTIADSATHKTTVVDCYFAGKIGKTYNDSTAYMTTIAGWMATTTTTPQTGSRWAMLFDEGGFGDGVEFVRNSTQNTRYNNNAPGRLPLGNGPRTTFQVWHYNSNRLALRQNDSLLWDDVTAGNTTAANITYTGTGKLYIGTDAANKNWCRGSFRTLVLFGTTQSDHAGIASYLKTLWGISDLPATWSSGDGFNWNVPYYTGYIPDTTPDVNGNTYWYENGSYPDDGTNGPSFCIANNVSNGVSLVRFCVHAGDSDTIVTGAERSERGFYLNGNTAAIARGNTWERFAQFLIEPGPIQDNGNGSWALMFQVHYSNSPNTPDAYFLSFKGENFQVITQRLGVDTSRGSSIPVVRNRWYAIRFLATWSSSGTADSLQVWFGQNGTTLTQIVNVTGALFTTDDTQCYCKQGIYRGDVGTNNNAVAARFANEKFSLTSGAFASYVTTQPPLPAFTGTNAYSLACAQGSLGLTGKALNMIPSNWLTHLRYRKT